MIFFDVTIKFYWQKWWGYWQHHTRLGLADFLMVMAYSATEFCVWWSKGYRAQKKNL